MEIIDAKPEDVPSKLKPLMGPFLTSPFHAAPERKSEMIRIMEEHKIRIAMKADAEDWLFEERRIFDWKRVFVGMRSIERLWAFCYGYTAITTELTKAASPDLMMNDHEFDLGFKLLSWASQETLEDREGGWPDELPDPSQMRELEHVRTANHCFLMTSGRMLLHEFAHTVLNHHTAKGTSPDVLIKEEFEADAWADAWMLEKWKEYNPNEKTFVARCIGIAVAHAPSLIFGADRKTPSLAHPNPIHRITSFIDRYLPNNNPFEKSPANLPLGFLMVIATHLLLQKDKHVDWNQVPKTYQEWFGRIEGYFN